MLLEQHKDKTEFLDFIAARQAYFTRLQIHSREQPPKFEDFRLLGESAKRHSLAPDEHLAACERLGIKIETI